MEDNKLEDVDLSKAKGHELLKVLIASNLVGEQGLRVSGNGLIIKELEKLNKQQDKTTRYLHFIEEKLDKIIERK